MRRCRLIKSNNFFKTKNILKFSIKFAHPVCDREIEIKVDHLRQRPPASEVEILQSDPSYAKKILGWEYKVSLEEGIKRTYQWIQNNPQKYSDPRKYVI